MEPENSLEPRQSTDAGDRNRVDLTITLYGAPSPAALLQRDSGLRIVDVPSDLRDEALQRVRSPGAQEASPVPIGIDVERGLFL